MMVAESPFPPSLILNRSISMDIYINEKSIFDYKHPIQNRTEPYYGYVYFSFNLINGKKYIGQSGKVFNGKCFFNKFLYAMSFA